MRPRRNDFSHEHEFEEPSEEIIEDGSWNVQYDCNYAEILNSYTDSQRDETYYETGRECDAVKHVRLDCTLIERVLMGGTRETVAEGDSVLLDEEHGALAETLECKLVDELGYSFQPHRVSGGLDDVTVVEADRGWDDDHKRIVDVTVGDDDIHGGFDIEAGTYRLHYDNVDVEVNE